MKRRGLLLWLGAASLAAMGITVVLLVWRAERRPVYRVDIAREGLKGWQGLGGAWSAQAGDVINDSFERGAKLLFGSPEWSDYLVSADVQVMGSEGDAGLIVRSNDEELGSNAYSGYYAGLRTLDKRLVLGRANYGWLESQTTAFPGGLERAHWYRLEIAAVGCKVVAVATDFATGRRSVVALAGEPCYRRGRIGLRSYGTGARWRNLRVQRADATTIASFYAIAARGQHAPRTPLPSDAASPGVPLQRPGLRRLPPLESIGSLRYASAVHPLPVTIRGTVVLRRPMLVVQDQTGGIAIPDQDPTRFAPGVEVEASGTPVLGDFSLQLRAANVEVLGLGRPLPPKSVTASDAATGAYDAQYIELTGRLEENDLSKSPPSLLIGADSEAFLAMLPAPSFGAPRMRLPKNSLIRVRGVEEVDPAITRNRVPFVLFVPTADNVELLARPPWWSLQNLLWLVPIAVILLLLSQMLRVRVRHLRMQVAMEERERLGSEIHDTLAQSFAGVGYQLQAVRACLAAGGAGVSEHIDLAIEMVRHSHQEARRSIVSLQEDRMAGTGLAALLERRARHMARGTALRIRATTRGEPRRTSPRVTDALFRIGLEAIANTLRHAAARQVEIELAYESRSVRLVVTDDGGGFDPTAAMPGLGLRSMRRRAENAGAELTIRSRGGSGTHVELLAPLGKQPKIMERLRSLHVGRSHAEG